MADIDVTLGLDKETPKLLKKQLKEAFSLSGLENVTEGQRAYFKRRVSGIRSSLSRKETSIFESDLSKVQKKKALDVEFAMALSKTLDLRRQLFSGKLPELQKDKVQEKQLKAEEKEKARDKVQEKQLKAEEKEVNETKSGFSKLTKILTPLGKLTGLLTGIQNFRDWTKKETQESRQRAVEYRIAENILGEGNRGLLNKIITNYEMSGVLGKKDALAGLFSLQEQRTQAMLGKNPSALEAFKWLGVDYMERDVFKLFDKVYDKLMKFYTSRNKEERRLAVSFARQIFGDERHLIPMLERFRNPNYWQENQRFVNAQQRESETSSIYKLQQSYAELEIASKGLKDTTVSLTTEALKVINQNASDIYLGFQDQLRENSLFYSTFLKSLAEDTVDAIKGAFGFGIGELFARAFNPNNNKKTKKEQSNFMLSSILSEAYGLDMSSGEAKKLAMEKLGGVFYKPRDTNFEQRFGGYDTLIKTLSAHSKEITDAIKSIPKERLSIEAQDNSLIINLNTGLQKQQILKVNTQM